jgi:hypothetical protein
MAEILTMDDVRKLAGKRIESMSLQERFDRTKDTRKRVDLIEQLKEEEYLVIARFYHEGAIERAEPLIDELRSAGLNIGISSDCQFTYCSLAPRGITRSDYSAGADGFIADIRIYRRKRKAEGGYAA